jgi:phosphate transport system protein
MYMPDKHLSTQFDADLEVISNNLMRLGGMVEAQVSQAIYALSESSVEVAEDVLEIENEVNALEIEIDHEIASFIARRQPTAGDLRLLVAMSKTTANLERAGDEAAKIARKVTSIVNGLAPLALPFSELRVCGGLATELLRKTLDAFVRLEVPTALEILQNDGILIGSLMDLCANS